MAAIRALLPPVAEDDEEEEGKELRGRNEEEARVSDAARSAEGAGFDVVAVVVAAIVVACAEEAEGDGICDAGEDGCREMLRWSEGDEGDIEEETEAACNNLELKSITCAALSALLLVADPSSPSVAAAFAVLISFGGCNADCLVVLGLFSSAALMLLLFIFNRLTSSSNKAT